MARDVLAKESLVSQSTYVHEIRRELSGTAFAPSHSRLWLLPIYFAVIAAATWAVASGWLPWFLWPVASLAIGACFGLLAFVAHEGVHGGIVRNRTARQVIGWFGFLSFCLSPRLWSAWHDRVHHSMANVPGDPDMYPSLAEYRSSRKLRFFVNAFALGNRRLRGVFSLILGFNVQGVQQLLRARERGFLDTRQWLLAMAESAAGLAVWVTLAIVVGFVPFLFVFVIPHLIGNTIVMMFILTNHGLSPRVEINDPLVNGLSVTSPRWIEWITLKFGYHVEHHLFPGMSSRHARVVRDQLRLRWPGRYQSMPLRTALRELHRTARVYKDAVTLIDPLSGREFPTLMPS